MHWTSQKPQQHARACGEMKMERWIGKTWPGILRRGVQHRVHIALLDESGLLLSPPI